MSAVIFDISTGKRLPDTFEPSPEQIVSSRIKQALKHWPPQIVGDALHEGFRRLTWGRSPTDAADAAITWANRQILNLPPDNAA